MKIYRYIPLAWIASAALITAGCEHQVIEEIVEGETSPIQSKAEAYYYGQTVPLMELATLEAHCLDHGGRVNCFDSANEVNELLEYNSLSIYCTLYKNSGYGAPSYTFSSGQDYNDIHEVGMGDNVSSVFCSGGGMVRLFQHKNFSGSYTAWFSSDSYLTSPKNFNDIASSVEFNF